ncbi:MAG: nitrous oxide reductase protein NosZ [Ignavibacteria bacterium]|nr:MAG: nitrous oxide reductase protein NosZ [Ignavibacteria bacterium]KAF0155771.1 MAG: nitrous oxide reductase protein NosZ [Ignavibacteria bacterium]
MKNAKLVVGILTTFLVGIVLYNCSGSGESASAEDAAKRVYVKPGSYDEFYAFMSGGFNGQLSVYGLPSGRMLKNISVFSQNPETGYGYSEESKGMLMTSYGFIPWDDSHHPVLSKTNGEQDGKWIFINGNNTPRIARIDLRSFETVEIIEIPNSAGNHGSPFLTENTEYVVASTRFSVPIPNKDVPISTYKENFKGTVSFISVDKHKGDMKMAFQIVVPGLNYDLAHAGKGPSHGWVFFTSYNSEQANTLLEINASQNDKDFIAAVNWKKAEEYVKAGKAQKVKTEYYHNLYNENTQTTESQKMNDVLVLDPEKYPGMIYYIPTPKSPHGVDIDPSGKYIVAGGKLSSVIPVHSFEKMIKAIDGKLFDGNLGGIPILKYDEVLAGEVINPGLGPLHTEFDGKGYAYTSAFLSSEIVKWKLGTWEVVDRIPTYYSIGHLMIPGGDSKKPSGKYVVALNKITKDRYLPTGPELTQSAQLYDISGDKMQLLLDFPTIGEPHYAQAIPADLLAKNSKKIYPIEKNNHKHAVKSEKEARIERKGNEVHVYMSATRSHFKPDNIEGIKVGDKVYWHVTNLEQDWDIPHGFTVKGMNNSELLIMPGQTKTIVWNPTKAGIYPFYCTDFCSALHQEMQGYVRVSDAGSNVKLSFN